MDDITYVSQKEAIDRNAVKKGISLKDVLTFTDRTLERARRELPGRSDMWYLSFVENCAWENFFPGEPFPGKVSASLAAVTSTMNQVPRKAEPITSTHPTAVVQSTVSTQPTPAIKPVTDTKVVVKIEPVVKVEPGIKTEPSRGIASSKGSAIHRSTDRDWVHDLYDGDRALGRAERSTGDYWPTRVGGPAREGDFYRPSLAKGSENTKSGEPSKSHDSPLEETREHYGRLSRPDLNAMNPTRLSSGNSKYDSQEHLIWRNTAGFGVARSVVAMAFEEEGAKVKASYSAKSSDWQKWATEWAVWSRFFTKSRFPGVEPIGGSKASSRSSSAMDSDNAAKSKLAGPAVSARQVEPGEIVKTYEMQEKKMEDLARKRGIRPNFFSYLQRARDQARLEHRDCTSEIRHYVADRMTWNKFFSDLPFVGNEPKEGHSRTCRNRSLSSTPSKATRHSPSRVTRASPPTAPRRDRVASGIQMPVRLAQSGGMGPVIHRASAATGGSTTRASAPRAPGGPLQSRQPSLVSDGVGSVEVTAGEKVRAPAVQPQGFIDTQPSLNMLASLGIARHSPIHDESKSGIIMVGSKTMFSDSRKTAEVFDHLIADNTRAVAIRETLQCTFRYHRTAAGHLLLWATSDHNDAAAVDRGQAFLQGWIDRVLGSGMIRPFSYWNEMCLAMFSSAKQIVKAPQDFQSASACWEEYKNITGATLVDCLLVEEKAKGEGELRMVLDKVTEEVVTVKELLKRHEYRVSSVGHRSPALVTRSVPGSSTGEKRKKDGDGDEILPDADTKRLCI